MSPATEIEILFLQYKAKIERVAFKDDDYYKPYLSKDEEKIRFDFEWKLQMSGFEYVGGGISRKTFVHKRSRRCFKLNYNGLPENEQEMKTFLEISKRDRVHFAACYGFLNGDTDMMEVEFIDWPLAKEESKFSRDIKNKANETIRKMKNRYKFDDMHGGNYAINPKTGEVKILDYAMSKL